MYPSELPAAVRADAGRRAECFVYDQLTNLPDPYHVFYSVKWQAESRRGIQRDGEADFVLAHPERGVLVLEVKGGRVEYHGHTDQWVSLDRQGRPRPGSTDPFEQARESHHALLDVLVSRRGWRHDRLQAGYAIALPDVVLPRSQPLPPAVNESILLDAPAFDQLEPTLARAFAHWQHPSLDDRLGEDRLELLVALLDGWVALPPRQSHAALSQQWVALTHQQLFLLDALRHQHRALIGGCAGSGKTLLALEKARRLAAAGQSVLLTCFNRPLGEYLAQVAPTGVTAGHFHGLCAELATIAGVPLALVESADQPYFDDVLPNALVVAARQLGRRFDALVLDEAQDFKDQHWLALVELLADPDHGTVYAFYDTNQDLYTPDDGGVPPAMRLISDGPPLDLSRNCRTTLPIHRVAMAFHEGETDCGGPEGAPVDLVEYGGRNEQVKAVRSLLHQLAVDEGIPTSDIVVLTGHRPDTDSPFAPGTKLGNLVLTTEAPGPGQILVSTVQRFKGLERRAVILADLDDQVRPGLASVLYVGCSRAQERLAVVIHAGSDAGVRERLRAAVGNHT